MKAQTYCIKQIYFSYFVYEINGFLLNFILDVIKLTISVPSTRNKSAISEFLPS